MARSDRHFKIIDIISKYDVNTQEELARLLREEGFNVTQATVSRDIKDLGLIKTMTDDKKYKYSYVRPEQSQVSGMMMNIFKETVISIESAQNIIVVKCISAGANASAAMIDNLNIPDIIGTVAGDDTIIIVVSSTSAIKGVMARLKQLTN